MKGDKNASAFIVDTINKAAEHLAARGKSYYPKLEFFSINLTELCGFTEPDKLYIKARRVRLLPNWLQVRLWLFLAGRG